MGPNSESTESERAVVRACIEEAFWRRSLPSALATMTVVSWHLKRRPVPFSKVMSGTIIVGASSLAYFLGKLSYILGEDCMKKFIEQAPESEITIGVLKNREERQRLTTRAPSNLPPFKDILKHVDMETMSLDEQSVVMECNRVAFWKFSLPCMSGSTGLAWLLFKQGLLQGRPSASFPRLPKLFLAALFGYTGGQVLYAYSQDCSRRLLIKAPGGEAAKRIQSETGKSMEEDLTENLGIDYQPEQHAKDFIIPEDTAAIRQNIIQKQV